jgi:pseudouridine-5'-phosphate glycosidase
MSVALESTVISHGLPYPQNLELALEMESIVRATGASAHTCGIVHGELSANLTLDQITNFATSSLNHQHISKVSRRDLPIVVNRKLNGATTVSATMIIAAKHGIEVFATGGIGGVHRSWETTLDISADLEELAESPVLVVCSGPKAILDIPATMEYLETKGVTVVGYQTDEVPGFFSRTTSQNLKVDIRCDTAEEVASLWLTKKNLGLRGGMLVLNPIPKRYEIPVDEIASVIDLALTEASQQSIRGAAITPFLLRRLSDLTGSRSLNANLELLKSNARVAGEIAVAIERQKAL